MSEKIYEHDLSPFIFELKNLNFQWMENPLNPILLFIGFVALFSLFFWVFRKKGGLHIGSWSFASLSLAGMISLGFALVATVAAYFAKTQNWEWGLRWYSTMYVLGFIWGYLSMIYWIKSGHIKLSLELLDSLIAHIIFGMILGARLTYVFIYNLSEYKENLLDVFRIWEGGLSFHGGIIGVILAILIFCKRNKISFWHIADYVSLTVPFGIGLGRIGNFINGELYGRIVQGKIPWAVIFPEGGPYPRHPSQLYQSLGEGWLLLLTLHILNMRKHYKEGTISVAFIGFYAFYRYFMEFYREPDSQLSLYLSQTTTMGQLLCLVTALCAVTLYFLIVRKNPLVRTAAWFGDIQTFQESRKSNVVSMSTSGNKQ